MISEGRSRWRAALTRLSGGDSATNAKTSLEDGAVEDCELPFVRRQPWLDVHEAELYRALVRAVGTAAAICPKVRVSNVLSVSEGAKNINAATRIDRKVIDMLVCDGSSLEPRLAIQIDVWDERQQDYQPRDVFLDRALTTAGLTVFHVRSNQIPSLERMRSRIVPLLGSNGCQSNDVRGDSSRTSLEAHAGHAARLRR